MFPDDNGYKARLAAKGVIFKIEELMKYLLQLENAPSSGLHCLW